MSVMSNSGKAAAGREWSPERWRFQLFAVQQAVWPQPLQAGLNYSDTWAKK